MNLVYIKLSSNEDIIGELVEFDGIPEEKIHHGPSIYLNNVLKVMNIPLDQTSIVVAMADWFPGSHKMKQIPIQHEFIIGKPFPVEDTKIHESYLRMVNAEDKLKSSFLDIKNKIKRT